MKIRGTGYGEREVTYERQESSTAQWVPITQEEIQKLLKNGVVIHMNPRS